tara:strand:- start:3858 stop:4400 length:543 start_codon:yes stop_codon:yes gene_type:complete
MNYYPIILRNLETLMKMNEEGGSFVEKNIYKVKAYEKAIKRLPTEIENVLTKNIAGPSIMRKINTIIRTNNDLPEVSKYLEMNKLIKSQENEFDESTDSEESDYDIEDEFYQDTGNQNDEESSDDEESDHESECQDSLCELKTLLKLEKHILDLDLKNQKVKDILALILNYKKDLIKQVL